MKSPGTRTRELFWGYFLVIFGSITLFGFLFASNLLPLSQKSLIGAMENDRYYYCFLLPSTLPVIMGSVYFHWLSMKIFKHA